LGFKLLVGGDADATRGFVGGDADELLETLV